MKKKKDKNNLACAGAIILLLLLLAVGYFVWSNRFEIFPSLVKNGVPVYFLNRNGEDKIIRCSYDDNFGKTRFEYAISCLINGPSEIQKLLKTYSEIPYDTKIIAIIQEEDKNIIDLTSAFNTGGGTESIYKKLNQIIKTVEANTDKPTYLFINGVQTEVFGGEGIMITQPLSRGSL